MLLVSEDGTVTGESGKLAAHEAPGHLHLAFSVVLYRSDGKTLLQRRALSKYHFPGAWANACCSHPGPDEDLVESAQARVREELGVECSLIDVGSLIYRATCRDSGLVEHELDHVLVGVTELEPDPNPAEVEAVRWADPSEIVASPPDGAAPWLVPVIELAQSKR